MLMRLIIFLLMQAWLYLIAGLLILGAAGYTCYNVSRGGSIPPREALTELTAQVNRVKPIIEETRSRRGRVSRTLLHHELMVEVKDLGRQVWRAPSSVNQSRLQRMLREQVVALVDVHDDNMVYQISRGGVMVFSYEEMAELSLARAQRAKDLFTHPIMLGSGVGLMLFGAVWLLIKRRKRLQEASNDSNNGHMNNFA